MGAVRLGGLAGFLSDPLISGFTTGSAVLVVVSQMKHIFGQTLPQITGALAAPRVSTIVLNLVLFSFHSVLTLSLFESSLFTKVHS